MPCKCPNVTKDGYEFDQWIQDHMQDCIYTPLDMAAFVIGMSSLAFWICCQAPQFIKNWRNGTAEALSLWFLLEWLGGDLSNMIGTILTRQVPTQYAFLHFRNKWRREKAEKLGLIPPDTGYKEDENQSSGSESDDDMPQLQMDQYHPKEEVLYRTTGDAMTKNCEYQSKVSGSQALTTTQSASSTIYDANSDDAIAPLLSEQPPANRRDYMPTNVKNVNGKHIAGTTLLMALVVVTYGMYMSVDSPDDFVAWGGDDRLARRLDLDNCQPQNGKATPKGREIAGQVLGYISTVLYLNSRLPQVYKNFKRQSVVGLSWLMFFCAFMGNLTTVISIIMRIHGDFSGDAQADWRAEAPFFPGAAGTLVFDFLIMFQYFVYTKRAKKRRKRRAELRKKAKQQNPGKTPAYLQDTPALAANAPRGIHDLVESPPVRPDDDEEALNGGLTYGTDQKMNESRHAHDDFEVGRRGHGN